MDAEQQWRIVLLAFGYAALGLVFLLVQKARHRRRERNPGGDRGPLRGFRK